ncbi:MAG: PD-(D/E)XK nuclease family protein [Patescibacteria group bacterium]
MYFSKFSYIYDPKSNKAFKLSRSKIELFVQCPRCFYLDVRCGIKRPSFPSFTLNSAVDFLLKKEFDIHRSGATSHPLMTNYGLKAIPFAHPKMEQYRHNFTGLGFLHQPTNFWLYGAVDDIWIDENQELIIVDYKSTSTDEEITLEGKWKEGYKRQMEIYQWLARREEGLKKWKVSNNGYFVYCNGLKDRQAFDAKLEFAVQIISYIGDDSWVEETINKMHACLIAENMPLSADDCEYCAYRQKAVKEEIWGGKTLFG